MFIAALFSAAKTQKQPVSLKRCMDKEKHIYVHTYMYTYIQP